MLAQAGGAPVDNQFQGGPPQRQEVISTNINPRGARGGAAKAAPAKAKAAVNQNAQPEFQ